MDFFTRIPLDGSDEFQLFSLTYFIALFIALLLLYLSYRYLHKLKNTRIEPIIRYLLAFYMLYTTFNIYQYFYVNHMPWIVYVPDGMCNFAIFIGAFVLVTKNRKAFVVLFFWGWGAFIALFAPNILEGPSHYFFYQFYLRHLLIIISAFYMMHVHDYKIHIQDYRIYVYVTLPAALLGLGIGYLINDPVYANLFYMLRPAVEGTPLDALYNIHPLFYTFVWVVIAFIFGFLYGLPFYERSLDRVTASEPAS